jgi:4-hydroxybenzoate polyprenyltransferase
MILYSLLLKSIVILDVITIALGFVTRAVAGGVLIEVEISNWLLIVTIFLALFLGFSKRRSEMVNLDKKSRSHRPILDSYSIPLLDQLITITASGTLIAYTLYTQAEQTIKKFGSNMWITVPIVIYVVFRYFYLVYIKNSGSSPSRLLLQDKSLLIGVIVWIITMFFLVYWSRLFGNL